jgi:polysaccharide deacetylase family protein (PEP-CTERM system associated)
MNREGSAFMTIDVEDWFQVENLHAAIPRETWPDKELRVQRNVDIVLDLLARRGTRATFFVLGWIAHAVPALVKRIHDAGHEVGCHGYGHEMMQELTPETFRADVLRSKHLLEDLCGEEVIGYRAPNFSITDWALDVLADVGFRYDSSLFPAMAHDRYGKVSTGGKGRSGILEIRPGLREVVVSCMDVLGRRLPWAGGGYFRLVPYRLFRAGIRSILNTEGMYCFYIHPWEFDPGQPRVRDINLLYRFRHYQNLRRTAGRFERLLGDFSFTSISSALKPGKIAG